MRRSRVGLAGLAAAAGLAGCVDLAPRDHRPPAAAPPSLPAGGAYPPAAPAAAADRGNAPWREVFVDSRLQGVIDLALANNRDLRIAVANVAAARAQFQAQRAQLLPKVTANGQATYGQIPYGVLFGGQPNAPSGVYNERIYSANGAISAFQLDLFGKVRDLTRAALEQYFATREARDAARITLIGAAADAWLTLAADRAEREAARDTLASSQESLELTRARLAAGVASGLDVEQATTLVEQARFDLARLTVLAEQDRNALDLIAGVHVPDRLLAEDIPSAGLVLDRAPAGLPSRLLLARPDVAQAEDLLKAANANVGAARAAYFPDITLTASGGVTSLALSTLFRGASETWSFVPAVTEPIFDFGATRAGVIQANAQRAAALAAYDRAVQTAFREVADALAAEGSLQTEVSAQQALADAAARAASLADARYQRGADSYLNALIARRTLYAARQSLTDARRARALNVVTLYTALGGGLR